MNKKCLPGAVLFIIAFVISDLAFPADVKAVDASDTFYGVGAGNTVTTGLENSAFGFNALAFNLNGSYNTASGGGDSALFFNTTGGYNTASGYYALHSNTNGSYNTASGLVALYSNTSGDENTAGGDSALYSTLPAGPTLL